MIDLGDRFRLVANEIDIVEPTEPLPTPAGRPGGLASRGPTCDRRPRRG